MYVFIFAFLHGINVKKQTWGLTGIQTLPHTKTEVCDLRFWVLFNPLRLRRFCSRTWLWSPVPVASDQTRNRNPFPFLQIFSRCLASLISLLGSPLDPVPGNHESKMAFFFFCSHLCGISLKYLRVSLRYSEASLWWDQAMFGHECGFGWRDVNESECKLTELNTWGWRAEALARLERPA